MSSSRPIHGPSRFPSPFPAAAPSPSPASPCPSSSQPHPPAIPCPIPSPILNPHSETRNTVKFNFFFKHNSTLTPSTSQTAICRPFSLSINTPKHNSLPILNQSLKFSISKNKGIKLGRDN